MTAATVGDRTFDIEDPRIRRILDGPAEGWLTLVSVAMMVVALAWSLDDASWVTGKLTDSLPLLGIAGVLVGFIGPKLGWGRWTTHLLGVAFAAIVIPIVAGGIVLGDDVSGWGPAALAARYRESAQIVYRVWFDLAIAGLPRTSQYGHYLIVFGALVWATGQFAAYAIFGHRRALDAVMVTGLVLLANMSLTTHDQLHLMVLFTLAGLVLLTRAHAFDERITWLRRRIGDPATVTGLYLRGGAVFIMGAVLGSLILTASASSAPLQGLWKGVPGSLVEFAQWLQRYVPLGGDARTAGIVTFGAESIIGGSWTSSDQVAFRVQLPASETERFYWQAGAYAVFTGTSWSRGENGFLDRTARQALLTNTAEDAADEPTRREIRFEVTPDTYPDNVAISPMTIQWIDRDATVNVVGPDRYLAAVEFETGGTYEVSALVRVDGNEPGAITKNRLRAASTTYDSEIKRLYIGNPDSQLGPKSRAILAAVMERTPDSNPYDIALTMEAYLKDDRNFRYSPNIQEELEADCEGLSTVECFATIKSGFCQYYASTMAILLREAGIPTRLAQGFLPGDRGPDGLEIVRNSGAHAWVQVYFPGYGWVNFDPTGGGVAELAALPSGPPETPTPRPSVRFVTDAPGDSGDDLIRRSPGAGGTTDKGKGGPVSGPYIAIAGLLVIAAFALAFIAWRRGPRPMHPDRAWGSIGRWAGRFGLGPRASQTVYEYAGVLGEALPIVRPELSTVANAKVEVSYGRRDLGQDRMRAVAEAHRRLRLGLLRLAFRRRPRKPRKPRPPGRG